MAKREDRSRQFKRLRVTVFHEEETGVAFNDLQGQFSSISLFTKPDKVAKELRKIAKWLEKL